MDITKIDKFMAVGTPDEENMVYCDVFELPFSLEGLGYPDPKHLYRRFPENCDPALPEGVECLAWHTAGLLVRFRTDSTRVNVRVKLRNQPGMDHMPATGNSGFDLYLGESTKEAFYRITRAAHDQKEYTSEVFNVPRRAMRDMTIHFPLYNGVESVQIGLDANSGIRPPAPRLPGRVVVYGTSITQGGCASKPGACYTNILARKLNREVLNFGFSGNGRGERHVAGHLARIEDVALYVLDYEANSHFPDLMLATLSPFIDELRAARPDVKILVVSKVRYAREHFEPEQDNIDLQKRLACRAIEMEEVERRRAAGDQNIFFADGSSFLGEDYYECSVDGVHQTDMGFYRMADALAPIISNIL